MSGEPFDHRADLFSLAVVLSEIIIGKPLFPGAGQLAVLLAIRDCRIDPLRASANLLPKGLLPILEKGLAKSPDDRFSSAEELYAALAPYERPTLEVLQDELAEWVRWAADPAVLAKRIEGALRESTKQASSKRTPVPSRKRRAKRCRRRTSPTPTCELMTAGCFPRSPSRSWSSSSSPASFRHKTRSRFREPPFSASRASMCSRVTSLRRPLRPVGSMAPGIPDYVAEFAGTSMMEVLGWLLTRRETGVLFADRHLEVTRPSPASTRPSAPPRLAQGAPRTSRKSSISTKGAWSWWRRASRASCSVNISVRLGAIDRTELEMALLALPRYEGRLGDTLIGLGLVDPVEVFRAIQNQGRARVADVFRWPKGRASFYRGVTPNRVDFRLDLDIPELMLAGLEEAVPDEVIIERHKKDIGVTFVPIRPPPPHAMSVAWPASVLLLMGTLGSGRRLEDLLQVMKLSRQREAPEVLRAIEIALAGGLLDRRRS